MAQGRGVLGSTHGDCWPKALYFPLITSKFFHFQHEARCSRAEKYFVHCSVELLAVNGITLAMW